MHNYWPRVKKNEINKQKKSNNSPARLNFNRVKWKFNWAFFLKKNAIFMKKNQCKHNAYTHNTKSHRKYKKKFIQCPKIIFEVKKIYTNMQKYLVDAIKNIFCYHHSTNNNNNNYVSHSIIFTCNFFSYHLVHIIKYFNSQISISSTLNMEQWNFFPNHFLNNA